MSCHEIMEKMLEFDGDKIPLLLRFKIALHLLGCGRCSGEMIRYEAARNLLKRDFFPPSPGLAGIIMEKIYREEPLTDTAGAISFRSWVIIGIIVVFSLSSSFVGINFGKIAAREGSSFLLPLGLTIGTIVSAYGALFIGSHLEELSERFRLH
ncbi:peptidoglycan-binding protein [Treponema sp. TIM-1]|uniref:peptidoglycan-binding protein n=1 Tax=Treponema sp. TIM-1 TaxID=2898417 RepID=UPI00397F8CC5